MDLAQTVNEEGGRQAFAGPLPFLPCMLMLLLIQEFLEIFFPHQ
jgi:hypothetical protein